jgi:hypothetical protein
LAVYAKFAQGKNIMPEEIKTLIAAKAEALHAIERMAKNAHAFIDKREAEAMEAIEKADTAKEVYRLMGFIAAGESFTGRLRG